MDHTEMNTTDEVKLSTIRKKSSLLRDSSYRIFHITKKTKEDSDDDDNNSHKNNLNQTNNNKSSKKSVKINNQNGLKQLLFLHKTSCELSSIETKTPPSVHQINTEYSPIVICDDTTSLKVLKLNKQHAKRDSLVDWSQTDVTDRTIAHNDLLVRTDKFEPTNKKQILINIHPEIRRSFRRRRNRFIVACGTVVVALCVIITIIVYAIVMTVKHKTHVNQLLLYNHPH